VLGVGKKARQSGKRKVFIQRGSSVESQTFARGWGRERHLVALIGRNKFARGIRGESLKSVEERSSLTHPVKGVMTRGVRAYRSKKVVIHKWESQSFAKKKRVTRGGRGRVKGWGGGKLGGIGVWREQQWEGRAWGETGQTNKGGKKRERHRGRGLF